MKKLCLALALLAIILPLNKLGAQQKTDAELLEETVKLSKEVKEFGKTIGIEPTLALSKSSAEIAPYSMLWIWAQKKGTIATEKPIDIYFRIGFTGLRDKVPFSNISDRDRKYSIYTRQGDIFSYEKSGITTTLAKAPKWRQVELIFHEDLHGNIQLSWDDEESLVTALAYLAAKEYFKKESDAINLAATEKQMLSRLGIAKEIKSLIQFAEESFSKMPYKKALEQALGALRAHKLYYDYSGGTDENNFEAKVSHDWGYFKYFETVLLLNQKAGNIKVLIEDIKGASAKTGSLEKYLDELDQKYGSAKK